MPARPELPRLLQHPALASLLLLSSLPAQVEVFALEGTPASACGQAVAAVGDVDRDGFVDFAIGRPLEGSGAGRVDVYSGRHGAALLTFTGSAARRSHLGWSVAGAGDVDRDGYPDVIAGMVGYELEGAPNTGAARVWSGRDGTVLYTVVGDGEGDLLGNAVCSPGDVDRDGYDDFLVGAPENGSPAYHYGDGYARLYSGRNGSTLRTFPGYERRSEFGASVAGVGDVDGDGYLDVAVSSLLELSVGPGQGSVRMFSGKNGEVIHAFFSEPLGDHFGMALAGGADIDGDGCPDLIVGAVNAYAAKKGAVWVFSGADGGVLHFLRGSPTSGMLGRSVVGLGDVDGDGYDDFGAGDPGDALAGQPTGSLRVFSGRTGTQLDVLWGAAPGSTFGVGAAALDITGDGHLDVLVGAPGYQGRGRAAVWSLDGIALVGEGCGAGRAPRLEADAARLGQIMGLYVGRARTGQSGAIAVSLAPATPLRLSAPCTVYVDPGTALTALSLTIDPTGNWAGGLPIPPDPALEGTPIALQGVLAGFGGTIPSHLTNGVLTTVTK